LGAAEVRGFLTHLAAERNVAASTQNQALNALVFLYREIVGGELGWIGDFEPAKRLRASPTSSAAMKLWHRGRNQLWHRGRVSKIKNQ
jgi:hypothetical protein